jgi:hypothetical protein
MNWALRRLGLRADADARAVKRAYAALLKTTRPEDDPEGFQALNEAYRAALAWVQSRPPQALVEDDFENGDVPRDDASQAATDANAASIELPADVVTGLQNIGAQVEAARALLDRVQAKDTAIAGPSASVAAQIDDADAFDAAGFLDELIALAVHGRHGDLERWLHAQPALWSLARKAQIGQWLVQQWQMRRPPIQAQRFDVVADFFGLLDLNGDHDAYTIQRLRHRLHLAWEVQTKQMRALAERTGQDGGSVASNLRQTTRILGQLTRPLRWPQVLGAALMPGYPTAVRKFLQHLDYGDIDDLPPPIREDQVAFWNAAGDRLRLSKPRWAVSIARLFAYSALITLTYAGLLTLLHRQDSAGDVLHGLSWPLFAAAAFALLATVWLGQLAYQAFARWQALADDEVSAPRWHVAAIPLLVALAMGLLWAAPGDGIVAGVLVGLSLVFAGMGAWVRHRERSGPPLGRHIGFWRAAFLLLMTRTAGDAFGWFDDAGFLALIASAILFVWAKDLWIQRRERMNS